MYGAHSIAEWFAAAVRGFSSSRLSVALNCPLNLNYGSIALRPGYFSLPPSIR